MCFNTQPIWMDCISVADYFQNSIAKNPHSNTRFISSSYTSNDNTADRAIFCVHRFESCWTHMTSQRLHTLIFHGIYRMVFLNGQCEPAFCYCSWYFFNFNMFNGLATPLCKIIPVTLTLSVFFYKYIHRWCRRATEVWISTLATYGY